MMLPAPYGGVGCSEPLGNDFACVWVRRDHEFWF
jgi:hypothetical protein